MKKNYLSLIIFGLAFAFVEAAVVTYLRIIFHFSSNFVPNSTFHPLLNLGFIAFLSPHSLVLPSPAISQIEALREISTLIMLGSVAFLAAGHWCRRLGAFLISFAIWDGFYYFFLRLLTGWPKTLLDIDVFFINPVPWVGPVITPVVLCVLIFILGSWLYLRQPAQPE